MTERGRPLAVRPFGRMLASYTVNEIGNYDKPRGRFYWEVGHTKNITEWKKAWAHQ